MNRKLLNIELAQADNMLYLAEKALEAGNIDELMDNLDAVISAVNIAKDAAKEDGTR